MKLEIETRKGAKDKITSLLKMICIIISSTDQKYSKLFFLQYQTQTKKGKSNRFIKGMLQVEFGSSVNHQVYDRTIIAGCDRAR